MTKKNYLVQRAGSYGKPGDVIELDLGKKGLTDRQKVMLSEYKKPVIKIDNSNELNAANKEILSLKEQITKLNAALAKTEVELNDTLKEKPKIVEDKK